MSALPATVAAMSSGVALVLLLPARPRPPGSLTPPSWEPQPGRSASGSADRGPGGGPRAGVSVAAGIAAALLVGGLIGIALAPLVVFAVWRVVGRMEPAAVRRRRERLLRSLPHAVDLLASSLAVGASPTTAVQLVATAVDPPMREELELVASRLALGADPVRVWSEVGRHPQLGALGRALVRAIDSGASVSEAMRRLAEDLRRTARADVEARARAVGVRAAAPLGLCLLPAFILTGVVPLVAGSVEVLLLGR